MFARQDLVIYGGEGVCRVVDIGPSTVPGTDKNRLYYTLAPLHRTGQVITPVDTRVLMRPILTRQEAQELLAHLTELEPDKLTAVSPRMMKEHYQAVVSSYDCGDTVRLIRTVALRRAEALRRGKKPSQMDERYLKRAEDQLYGELGAALDIPREDVAAYIRQQYPAWPEL